jgi:hypothetical protein
MDMRHTIAAFTLGLIAASALAGCSRDIQTSDEATSILRAGRRAPGSVRRPAASVD